MALCETNLVSNCLKRIFLRDQAILQNSVTRFNNELNDELPTYALERFLVSSVFEYPRFRTSLRQGKLNSDDISHIEFFLLEKVGFNESTTSWICDVWAGAFDLITYKLPSRITCPNCNREENADATWRGRMVICPCCNATLHFSHTLSPTITKAGWPRKRTRNRRWVVVPPSNQNSEAAIGKAISNLLDDEKMSVREISEYISLPVIVSSLQSEIEILMNSLDEPAQIYQTAVVKGVTKAIFGDVVADELRLQIKPELVDSSLLKLENDEQPILFMTSYSKEGLPCLAFTSSAMHYRTNENYLRVPYSDLSHLQITREQSITDFRIGTGRSISTKGLGVTRASVMLALSTIQKCIQAFAEECK